MLLAAGCGGERTSSSPITEPGASATTPSLVPSTTAAVEVTTTESTVSASTEPAPTSTSTTSSVALQPVADLAVLRPDGLGSVDFVTPADEALAQLSVLLGPPDLVESIAPMGEGGDGCVEGAGWLDCLRDLRVVDEGWLAVWATYGLEVAMVDTSREVWPKERTSLQFGDWQATVAFEYSRLFTEEGLYPGMTVRDLRQTVPGVEFTYNEGSLDSFYVTFGERGGYWGRLDWNPDTDAIEGWDIISVQAALNEHGADLTVDGEWGPRSEVAWVEFLTDHGIEPFTLQPWLTPEVGDALALPPDNITIATLGPRPATETVDPAATPTDGAGSTSATVPGSDLSLDQILGQREMWMISNSNYATYSIEPCWTRDTDETPPYGIFQADPVDLTAVVRAGDVFICSVRTEPVGEPGNLLLAVLTDDGLVATQQSSSGEESLPFTAPRGLGCQEFIDLPDIAAWTDHDSYADWGPGAAYRLVVAYWFVEKQPTRMDPDDDGVPCEEVVTPEVIAAAWSGDF